MSTSFQLLLPCAFGIESVIREELGDLGHPDVVLENGRVFTTGGWDEILRLNLWLRTAERVQIVLARFPAADFDQLFSSVIGLPAAELIPADGAFPVAARSASSALSSTPAIQRTVKKALAQNLLSAHRCSELPESGAKYPIHVSILRDEAVITLDTTGAGLHRRGYRESAGEAPLKETLAAALVYLSGWNSRQSLYDPCCGSGTILIEAALLATGRAPGAQRDFLFEGWNVLPPAENAELRNAARAAAHPFDLPILGGDSDDTALQAAKANAKRAGLGDSIRFNHEPVERSKAVLPGGLMLSNPPYGERMSSKTELKKLYAALRRRFREGEFESLHLLSSDRDLEKGLQHRASKKRKLTNGGMRVDLYSFQPD